MFTCIQLHEVIIQISFVHLLSKHFSIMHLCFPMWNYDQLQNYLDGETQAAQLDKLYCLVLDSDITTLLTVCCHCISEETGIRFHNLSGFDTWEKERYLHT